MDTIEGNKLIANFMGILTDGDRTSKHFGSKPLQYHSSWDWLKPVVEKIGKMYDPYKYKAYEKKEDAWEIVELTIMNPINEVYDSVIKFIQWYNSVELPKPETKS